MSDKCPIQCQNHVNHPVPKIIELSTQGTAEFTLNAVIEAIIPATIPIPRVDWQVVRVDCFKEPLRVQKFSEFNKTWIDAKIFNCVLCICVPQSTIPTIPNCTFGGKNPFDFKILKFEGRGIPICYENGVAEQIDSLMTKFKFTEILNAILPVGSVLHIGTAELKVNDHSMQAQIDLKIG